MVIVAIFSASAHRLLPLTTFSSYLKIIPVVNQPHAMIYRLHHMLNAHFHAGAIVQQIFYMQIAPFLSNEPKYSICCASERSPCLNLFPLMLCPAHARVPILFEITLLVANYLIEHQLLTLAQRKLTSPKRLPPQSGATQANRSIAPRFAIL